VWTSFIVRGMRRASRLAAKVGARLFALWLLAACASESEDGGAAYTRGGCADWCSGGQTGSLIPVCGVTPNTMSHGVPASGAGIVVLSGPCGDARLLDALTVRDASGQPIPFSAEQLPNGEILIHPDSGLTPGSYTVSVQAGGEDEDAGLDAMPDAGEPAQTTLWQQTVYVQASTSLPQGFGEINRDQDSCSTVLELRPEADVLPYLGLLSVDIQVDSGAARPLIVTGTMKVQNGIARVVLPLDLLAGLPDGDHTLHIVVRLAGEAMPLETFMMTLSVPCDGDSSDYAYAGSESDDDGTCSAIGARGSREHESFATAVLVLIAIALRRRRRAAR
jgi:hypothetical protein